MLVKNKSYKPKLMPRYPREAATREWAVKGARALAEIQGEPSHYLESYQNSWFGGDGKNTGYTPEGVKALLFSETALWVRGHSVNNAISHFRKRFEYIHLKRACQILSALGSGDDVFNWAGFEWTSHKLLAQRVYANEPQKNQVAKWVASSVRPVEFIGGPPSKLRPYIGNLRTLLLDRVAAVILLGGLSALDSIIQPDERYTKFA